MRISKTNTILKRGVNKLVAVENTYHDTKQTDKASKAKSLNIRNIKLLIRYNKTREMFTQCYPSFKHSPNNSSFQCKKGNSKERVDWWLAICIRKPKVSGTSPTVIFEVNSLQQ